MYIPNCKYVASLTSQYPVSDLSLRIALHTHLLMEIHINVALIRHIIYHHLILCILSATTNIVIINISRIHELQRVRVFKFGPDYLDPQILERGSKAPVVQLDLWMAGEEWCKQQIYRAVTEGKGDFGLPFSEGKADFVLVEGAMGLYDGDDCSADLAAKFGIPVALVIDVCAMAQTAAAIAVGLRNYRDDFDMVG